jgi:hypothetical protein
MTAGWPSSRILIPCLWSSPVRGLNWNTPKWRTFESAGLSAKAGPPSLRVYIAPRIASNFRC